MTPSASPPPQPPDHRLGRRFALQWLGGAACTLGLTSCGDFANAIAPTTTTTTTTTTLAETTTTQPPDAIPEFPDEPAGRHAADGSDGNNVLDLDGINRADLTTGFAGAEGRAEGIATKVQLTVADARTGTAKVRAAVHLWHCDAAGRYSIYDLPDQNHLRGLQPTDDAGRVQFTTVFPGCRPDRWPHLHLQVFESARAAILGSLALKTTQVALPQSTCDLAYDDPRYEISRANFDGLRLGDDEVFSDGWDQQLPGAVGDPASGFVLSILVAV